MKKIFWSFLLQCCFLTGTTQVASFRNTWAAAPTNIPHENSIDAPLMGNGDIAMSVGYVAGRLRFYLSKNDFWRLKSQADGLSGPRVVGYMDIGVDEIYTTNFSAEQELKDGTTTCVLDNKKLAVKSWVSATENLVFIELEAGQKSVDISVKLSTPYNHQAIMKSGQEKNISWLTRDFTADVDIPTGVAVGMKIINHGSNSFVLPANQKAIIVIAVESKFKTKNPLRTVLDKCGGVEENSMISLRKKHEQWWNEYWAKSSVLVADKVLMKAYYQGLYTMGACSRDKKFPPGLFGWTTTDAPNWNGDYHLNYNFSAPFYGLYSANRIEQGLTQDAPLIDFIPRGTWYAKEVTNTRGILYPTGIGPLGIEPTRNFPVKKWVEEGNIEKGGIFWQQRSNAAYALVNMAQCFRCTYDKAYGKNIYPYLLGVVDFWEDYLKFEKGRYVIYGDAIHEGSGKDKNPILSLGLIRNAFQFAIELTNELNIDKNRQAKWKDILSKLSAYTTQVRNGKKVFRYTEEGMDWADGNGLGIQQIYPANAITLDSDQELLKVSQNTIAEMSRWQDINSSNSFYAAAIRVGYDPAIVVKQLHDYALHTNPNGFQLNNPHGIENAGTVANALNEMLCMSVGYVIRLFNGLPKSENASFNNIRTWGAFLISAKRENGVISAVKIISEKGKDFVILNPWQGAKVTLIRNGKKAESISGERIAFRTLPGETIELVN